MDASTGTSVEILREFSNSIPDNALSKAGWYEMDYKISNNVSHLCQIREFSGKSTFRVKKKENLKLVRVLKIIRKWFPVTKQYQTAGI